MRSADQLLVVTISDFEQRVAEISVGHSVILDNYRAAHQRAVRPMRGRTSREDLFQAMFHYRVLFEALISEPEAAHL